MRDGKAGSRHREAENREWLESLEFVLRQEGPQRAGELLNLLGAYAERRGVEVPAGIQTPYLNTIPRSQEVSYPGDLEIEQRIEAILRWNALAMVVRANKSEEGIGGHLSTYASIATIFEVGFNHFFRAPGKESSGDQIFFQGHASPGLYARAFLEGRLSEKQIQGFRREISGGISSYPHPWLMPGFWSFPTVSMGLASLMSIYQARFNRYLHNRGLRDTSESRVWSFMGDGEMDEPESLGAISVAVREGLDNLTFVINCNLQRLDGPVRGNGKIVQDLEAIYRGAGWNVIKVIWSSGWDELLQKDRDGLLPKRMQTILDGDYQRLSSLPAEEFRREFFGTDPRLAQLVEGMSPERFAQLRRGGHDRIKVFNAFRKAAEHRGGPTVILCATVKGYGLGDAAQGKNIAHQKKSLDTEQLKYCRDWLELPAEDDLESAPFLKPAPDSPEVVYLKERRKALGGALPVRRCDSPAIEVANPGLFDEFRKGTKGRSASTTMVLVSILSKLLRDTGIGKHLVPIVPDEARTFGMEGFFKPYGIYSPVGQLYEPVDHGGLMYYREAKDGQILQEGISEAGAMSSFIAAATSYSTHGLPMIPFYLFYSMFGFQRIGDLAWAAGDMRARGFLIGATAGRTTLNGEGLQHEDGHSHLLAYSFPTLRAYDPAYAYELAVIVSDGLRRMYKEQEDVLYYITAENENYVHPPMPEGAEEGILRGLYRCRQEGLPVKRKERQAHLFGSGAILNEAVAAAEILEDRFQLPSQVWSITSFKALHQDGLATERRNRLRADKPSETPYLSTALEGTEGAYVVASDYLKALADSIARWFPRPPVALGTDGFGRSDSRRALRRFFEVDRTHIAWAALSDLAARGIVSAADLKRAAEELEIDPEKPDPLIS